MNEIQSEHDEKEERKRRERKRKENAAWREQDRLKTERLITTLAPDRVPLRHALVMLGRMSRSRFYELAAEGKFDTYKDGSKLTVGTPSIDKYNASLPPAKIGKQQPRGP
jgi:hypothetical protein